MNSSHTIEHVLDLVARGQVDNQNGDVLDELARRFGQLLERLFGYLGHLGLAHAPATAGGPKTRAQRIGAALGGWEQHSRGSAHGQ